MNHFVSNPNRRSHPVAFATCLKFIVLLAIGVLQATPALAAKPGGGGGSTSPAQDLVFQNPGEIVLASADGTSRRVLYSNSNIGGCSNPRWAPTGQHVAYPASRSINILNMNGVSAPVPKSETEPVYSSGSCSLDWYRGAKLGENATLIAFSGTRVPGEKRSDVYLLTPDDGATFKVTDNELSSEFPEVTSLSWSPEGGRIALLRSNNYPFPGRHRIHVITLARASGSGVDGVSVVETKDVTHLLTDSSADLTEPAQVEFANAHDGLLVTYLRTLYYLDLDKGYRVQLTGGPNQSKLSIGYAAFSPDDKFIVFRAAAAKGTGTEVYRMAVNVEFWGVDTFPTGTPQRILSATQAGSLAQPDWNPTWTPK
jgi:dipeptidyl aminopeptidase/acylaminoacyl peptidase